MASLAVTDDSFKKEILDFEGLVLVDFWAEWCGPCKVQSPIIDKLSEEYKDNTKIKLAKVDVDDNQKVAGEYQILSIPTIGVFKNGEKIDAMVGLQSEEKIKDIIAKNS
ncbi:MAG TPA: thioredoxin [bacterium]|nr:thioredoxin [bacterium]